MAGGMDQLGPLLLILFRLTVQRTMAREVEGKVTAIPMVPPLETLVTRVITQANTAPAATRVNSLHLAGIRTRMANSNRLMDSPANSNRMVNHPTANNSRMAMEAITVPLDRHSMAATIMASRLTVVVQTLSTVYHLMATLASATEGLVLTTRDSTLGKEVTVSKVLVSIDRATGPEHRSTATSMDRLPLTIPITLLPVNSLADKDMAEAPRAMAATTQAMMVPLADIDTELYPVDI